MLQWVPPCLNLPVRSWVAVARRIVVGAAGSGRHRGQVWVQQGRRCGCHGGRVRGAARDWWGLEMAVPNVGVLRGRGLGAAVARSGSSRGVGVLQQLGFGCSRGRGLGAAAGAGLWVQQPSSGCHGSQV